MQVSWTGAPFALDAARILSGEDKRTTLMVKNIPNKYTQKMLLQVGQINDLAGGLIFGAR